ncbi:uncharacterized protein PV06_06636 [Exophiala oligosperma]|uniref:Secreted protein n=1 Tax=Exophiala oligosperma TaxID=215243 RepID=A0A0D2DZU1_9EURO|nr:uncharacterized protein PV06_06636 [Exophiala oligosperma]KIW41039.1 hypothetical protein PV06_06636 [Exophiala oligosperma]
MLPFQFPSTILPCLVAFVIPYSSAIPVSSSCSTTTTTHILPDITIRDAALESTTPTVPSPTRIPTEALFVEFTPSPSVVVAAATVVSTTTSAEGAGHGKS